MKHLIKILLVGSLIIPAAFFIVTYGSCNKDKCKGVTCYYGGVCHGGACTCAAGYDGANCSDQWRTKFLGNWSQVGNSSSTTTHFSVSISVDTSNVTKVLIANFDNTFTEPLEGDVTSSDTLIIPHQLVQNRLIEGYAYYISSTDITVYYETLDIASNQLDSVTTKW